MNKFEQLGLSESLLKAILDLGFENPTEVQEKAILLLEKKDTDMVAGLRQDRENGSFFFQLFRKLMPTIEIHKH
jgi:ATP-dependent RNA helicase DeaD